ncbi:MAG: tetratricopeptide repeat protein [Bacteroidales bacterium]|nr:tetratricopeptide repeat protein [Bacteroidales bacterium]
MKKFKQNYLTIVVAAAFILSSCGGITKMKDNASTVQYSVTPNPLEMHAGEVQVTIKTTFPEKYFNKKAVVVATPYLKYEGGEVEFESTTLQGESVEANNKVISYDGGDYSYTGKVPYKDEMMRSELLVKMSASIKDKTPIEIPGIKIADGIITTPTLAKVDPQAILIGDKFVRVTPESVSADIHYVINKADVRNAELKDEDIKGLEQTIKDVQANERKQLKGAKVSAYASPDGDIEKINTPLSENRGTSAERYLKRVFDKAKLTEAEQEGFLSIMSTPEDWEGFKKLMEESDIQDKELILRVLSMYSDPEVREKEIKNIAAAFKEVADKVLPKLRRSVMTLDVEVTGLSDEELKNLAMSDPDSLKLEEILYAAALVDDLNSKLTIYKKAAENFPKCFRAKNSVGVIEMKLGNLDAAKAAFEEAAALKDENAVKNNLGAVALAQGDMAKAEEMLTAAMGAGDQVSYNLGIIKIKQGDYKAAVNYFGNKPSFNAALAQLLTGDNDKALSTLNELGDVDDAMVYYLKAVASARGGKDEGVFNNLRTAVGKDAALKAYAKKDVEFVKYASNEAFTGIIQ